MKLKKNILPAAIWVLVAVYVVWALALTGRGYAGTTVDRIDIEIVDSSADRRLVTGPMVRQWIDRSGIEIVGKPLRSVDLQGIERVVANNGFVGKVAAYTSTDGVLRIEVRQRTPLLRLLTDGYDRYVTADGFVFGTPASSAIYVPVITGSYRPQFPSEFDGDSRAYCNSLIDDSEKGIRRTIKDLRTRKDELAGERAKIQSRIDAWKKVNTRPGRFDGRIKSEWKQQKEAEKQREIKLKEDSLRRHAAEIERLNVRIAAEQESIKKTREKYEDFRKLLNFVERLEDDSFWQSEIVQIIADRSASGTLVLHLVPRSGSFVIEFGEIANVDAKFDKLMKFYRDGLKNLGWDEFSVVSVAYKGQVVCRKR